MGGDVGGELSGAGAAADGGGAAGAAADGGGNAPGCAAASWMPLMSGAHGDDDDVGWPAAAVGCRAAADSSSPGAADAADAAANNVAVAIIARLGPTNMGGLSVRTMPGLTTIA